MNGKPAPFDKLRAFWLFTPWLSQGSVDIWVEVFYTVLYEDVERNLIGNYLSEYSRFSAG